MKTFSVLFVLGAALIAPGCGRMFEGKKAAEQSLADFHQMYNDGELAGIYAAAHAKMKSATNEEEFLDFIGAVRRKLGKVTQTSNTGLNIRTVNFTTTVILTQNTNFERGTGTETLTFEIDGEKAVLLGYNIDSKDLILK